MRNFTALLVGSIIHSPNKIYRMTKAPDIDELHGHRKNQGGNNEPDEDKRHHHAAKRYRKENNLEHESGKRCHCFVNPLIDTRSDSIFRQKRKRKREYTDQTGKS